MIRHGISEEAPDAVPELVPDHIPRAV